MAIPAADVSEWIRKTSPDYLDLLNRLLRKLSATIDHDTNHQGTPTRDWARNFQRFQTAFHAFQAEERERAKMLLQAGKLGEQFLSDAEYETAYKQMQLESVTTLSDDGLLAEVARRGIKLPAVRDDDED